MSEMMQCFVMHGIGKVGVMEKPVPRPGPSDAIIRTSAALMCTSDTHTAAGAIGDRRGLTLGHEAVGEVHELGELAAASGLFKIGQRVAVSAITSRFACDNCQRGYPVSSAWRRQQNAVMLCAPPSADANCTQLEPNSCH